MQLDCDISDVKLTPMLSQWLEAKKKYSDAILLFRMGDFYELFADDAVVAAPILDLALTSRDKNKSALKMAGFPYHSSQGYIAKLIEAGFKVAVCEQLEDPKTKKGIVKRGVTELFTPATFIEKENISGESNYLVGLFYKDNCYALAALDIASSNFIVSSIDDLDSFLDEIVRLNPKEVVFPKNSFLINLVYERNKAIRAEFIDPENLNKSFCDYLNVSESLAVALLEKYLRSLLGELPKHLGEPKKYSIKEQLLMDDSTRNNLNLFPTNRADKNNLLSILSDTKTSMGKRFLYKSLLAPSTSLDEIELRHTIVDEFLANPEVKESFRNLLTACFDVEKLFALANVKKITPKGMATLRDSLKIICEIKESYSALNCMGKFLNQMPDLIELVKDLSLALVGEPPVNIKDGNIFNTGYDKQLDEIYSLSKGSQDRLLFIEKDEKQKTGISSLKVRYTRVFGYYIEVTNTHLDKVPQRYFRKQTIANGERFVTAELNELEVLIATANDRIFERENYLFDELLKKVVAQGSNIIAAAKILGFLDCLASFAQSAAVRGWVRPKILPKEACTLQIISARHPVIEHLSKSDGSYFVPNDMNLCAQDCLLALITGPNMAGKSTIMRQVALVQIMAQMGCFVPAQKATLSICDAIFARVGASDNLALGRSTFMVEMRETSQILNQASKYSLILLDEIGRGTSTYDGLSIAQSVAEYIHDVKECRTLFATHYHELTNLQQSLSKLKNFYVEVEEKNNEIRFLYTIKEGFLGKSFGIQVAKLAGIPRQVIERSEFLLEKLEEKSGKNEISLAQDSEQSAPTAFVYNMKRPQLTLFTDSIKTTTQDLPYKELVNKICALDLNRMTPIGALNKINEWQKLLKSN